MCKSVTQFNIENFKEQESLAVFTRSLYKKIQSTNLTIIHVLSFINNLVIYCPKIHYYYVTFNTLLINNVDPLFSFSLIN